MKVKTIKSSKIVKSSIDVDRDPYTGCYSIDLNDDEVITFAPKENMDLSGWQINDMGVLKEYTGDWENSSDEEIEEDINRLYEVLPKHVEDSSLVNEIINKIKEMCLGNNIKSSRKPVKSAKHILKSGYYNTNEHPEGGGTCDYCGAEIAPGDGYEQDFQSTQDTASYYLFIALGGDENRAYMVTENRDNLVRWLQGADEDIDDDWVEDVIREIVSDAFDDKDGYMCSTCLEQRIKKSAEDWVAENW